MYGPGITDSGSETFQKVRKIRDNLVEKTLFILKTKRYLYKSAFGVKMVIKIFLNLNYMGHQPERFFLFSLLLRKHKYTVPTIYVVLKMHLNPRSNFLYPENENSTQKLGSLMLIKNNNIILKSSLGLSNQEVKSKQKLLKLIEFRLFGRFLPH